MSMFGRFTQAAQRAIVVAQEVAREYGHQVVGADGILAALLQSDGLGGKLLQKLGVSAKQIPELMGPKRDAFKGNVIFIPHAKRALELSADAAKELGSNEIDTEHLLLGILALGDGAAWAFLKKNGVTRERVLALIAEEAPSPDSADAANREHVVSVRLNKAALDKMDALVRADIFKSRSEAGSFLIWKGLQVQAGLIDKVTERLAAIDEIQQELKRLFEEREG